MSQTQLTPEKKYHISSLLKVGYKQKEIAEEIGVHPSSISRELRRNKHNDSYHPELAQIETSLRHKHKKKDHVITKTIERYIRSKLKEECSPEQI